ncbi:hypothetical protein DFH09DRAFT_942560, partial [Mycena vulgaris]
LHRWLVSLRDIYLQQPLRCHGCGMASTDLCPSCRIANLAREPRYRCAECMGDLLLWRECCVDKYLENPLYKIMRWNSVFFVKTSVKDIGLRIQFGHPPREPCLTPHPGYSEFVILHENGIHNVTVDFCGCEDRLKAGAPYIQLLRAGWYPATEARPQTAATFLALDKFVVHMVQAKTAAYDFYAVLERLTDNTGVKPPDRYQVFLRMARKYRHLLMLEHAGRGHNVSDVFGTGAGELVIECPVCPNPRVNLQERWENAPPEDRFLYVLFIALDACFRLKRQMVSSEVKDPGLGTGWAYVLENAPYQHFLLSMTDQKEMSTCSGLAALDYANTKFSRGYSTTGIGMGVCARHEFVQPNGVGDLQKGERFANMDLIFASILRHNDDRLRKIIFYNIVCQWWRGYRCGRRWWRILIGTGQKRILMRWSSKVRCQSLMSGEGCSRILVGLTEMEVRLQFTNEEAADAEKGVPALHEVTPSSFINVGLELEEQQ